MPRHPEYRDLWKKAGYKREMGSAEVVPPPSSEYRRVYHLTKAEYAISDISFAQLKVARFSELNDPFELFAVRSRAIFREDRARDTARIDKKYGLLSFSGDWTDPVLWAHYGDRNRGVCLGFDLKLTRAEEVIYKDERVKIPWQDVSDDPDSLSQDLRKAIFRTKFTSWSYEAEWRSIVSLADARCVNGMYFCEFGPNLRLMEVILGHKCVLPIQKMRLLVDRNHKDVTTICSRLADQHFGIVPNESTIP